MKALCWHGKEDVRIDTVPDPTIAEPTDVVIKITATAICGSDLHLYDGIMPTMKDGDMLGHEPMGEVVEVGSAVKTLQRGDRVVVPFVIACGECFFCKKGTLFRLRTIQSQRKTGREGDGAFAGRVVRLFAPAPAVMPGGQAEYLRVPYADVGPIKVESDLSDEQVLFLSDIFPTGYMAAENAEIEPGDTVAVWGCGPVGQFAINRAWMFGAGRVIAIDQRGRTARHGGNAGQGGNINFDKETYQNDSTK